MVDNVIHWLIVKNDGVYVDATLGCGGHSLEILQRTEASIVGIDLDIEQLNLAKERFSRFENRFMLIQGNFRFIDSFVGKPIDGVLFDLGYSSFQLDDPQRGFSYRLDGPLDMRYGREGKSAYDIIEEWGKEEIADVLYKYGGERHSRRIAKKIKNEKPKTTSELALLVRKSVPRKFGHKHLSRIFQAFRIAVNNEMENIKEGIMGAYKILKINGRLVVITYHSGEEKLLINTVNELGLTTLTKKPITPKNLEFEENPRCRSAHLRAFEK
jgi:16S rRNA (cytosine1402-N4)-methyltransferase